jgi:tetratricopeptide (TPR) repeat protein
MSLSSTIDQTIAEALQLYQAGTFAAAAERFGLVLQREPKHAVAMRLQGLALVRSGAVASGLPLLARARRISPRDPLVHLHYGVGLLEADRPARAAAMFRRAITMLPKDPVPWINFSTAILALGHAKAARAAARRALAMAPNQAEAHYALGRAEWAAQSPAGARKAFMEAVRLNPNLADAWMNLGLACFQLGHIRDATEAMHRALKARPGYGAAEANLAGFLLVQGDTDGALARLRAVIARDPNCVPARLNLANALLLDREAKEALQLLAGPVPGGREGAHWRAHRALALLLLGRRDEARKEIDAVPRPYGGAELLIVWRELLLAERAGESQAADGFALRLAELAEQEGSGLLEHRIVSYFDLAAFRARRREKDRAFEYWKAGHRLMTRVQPFSRQAFREFVEASIECFDAKRLNDGVRATSTDEAPLFIVGLPRSGTSLTEQILAAHPMVFGAGERAALNRCLVKLAGPALEARSVRRLAQLSQAAIDEASANFLAELHALAPAARFVVDKMPGNALHLGALATLLPGARIIHCVRDPRDIALSIFQLRFFGYHPYAHDLADLGWYIGEHERLMAHWHEVLPRPMLKVALSDWVNDFAGTLARVLDFAGLPYDSACERFYQHERKVRTASAEQVRRPINASGLGRWQAYAEQLAPLIAELDKAGLVQPQSAPS